MSESLFNRSMRILGAPAVKAQLSAVRLASMVPGVAEEFADLSALDALDFLPELVGRPEQLMPDGDWRTWIFMAGRGAGKTWSGSVATIIEAKRLSALVADGQMDQTEARLHVVAATASDLRDTIVEGPAGLLRMSPPWFKGEFEPSKRRVSWPGGAQAVLISADEPERARGLQCAWLWADEFASWRFAEEIWPSLLFGLRLGPNPRAMITTTPRPGKILRQLLAQPTTVVSRARTRDNAQYLAPGAIENLYQQFGNTRLGRQELDGELLNDNPGALFKLADIEATRVPRAPHLRRIVIGVDPAVSSKAGSDETGIVVCGLAPCSCKGKVEDHAYVLADDSGTLTPDAWARVVARAYERHKADRVIAEKNQGGDLVASNLRTLGNRHLPITLVHASRGKATRAEPIAALFEQRKVHMVGSLPKLEDQMVTWDPASDAKSPDRVDALVWALTDLVISRAGSGITFFNIGEANPNLGGSR